MASKESQQAFVAQGIMIVAKDQTLPPLCLRCGVAADGESRRFEALWNPHFQNPLGGRVGAVARVATNKRGVFRYFLCDAHRTALRKRMLRSAAVSAACFVTAFVGAALNIAGLAIGGFMLGVFAGMWIFLIWYHGRTPADVVYIDENYIYLDRAPAELLVKLPQAPAPLQKIAKGIVAGEVGRLRKARVS